MSRKIDRVNDLTVLTGDGEKVLVGEGVGKNGRDYGKILGKWGRKNWHLRLGKDSDQLWMQ